MGCAGHPANPWNSGPRAISSGFERGSMGIWGVYVSGEPGVKGDDWGRASSASAIGRSLPWLLPCGGGGGSSGSASRGTNVR